MTQSTDLPRPQVQKVVITDDHAGQRIDNYLRLKLKGTPKSLIYRIIRKGEVRVNGKRIKAEYKLTSGDEVRIPPVRVAERETPDISAKLDQVAKLEQCILYEDDWLLAINKPSGIAVHGGSGLKFGVIEALRALRPDARYLELVHRIDRETSGILLVAKKRSALRALHRQLQDKTVQKNYLALVKGRWPERRKVCDYPLQKNELQSGERVVRVNPEGKPSETRIKILKRLKGATLIQASPVTGRTHQIRVHTAAAGHPIACDPKYGSEPFTKAMSELGCSRLFLHAAEIRFAHPKDETTLFIEAPLDAPLLKVVERIGVEEHAPQIPREPSRKRANQRRKAK
ncbi:23S rRNA pseudouridine(955/2504/2580) synthase RluC [Corallincola spongiicola]|uniref:Pseudouridine synthase n=1 Tax=Corallincola spongiicola TaxID=2520508 RepID=A0ABY1WU03_9GAMM|nr:23S rRNA pseudouridine(955/2504/2580) synthase RluC [Corallincola spongiicola]TAA48167.1 23S rRNA pseudouridine(955/2504/2580) synthase RluC [Corallincola spongiicola]